ncbi:MAG: hypothetical protein K8F91_21605 [Candidatus Obscuribacterales bacterium]|nr:hypothetical protein [Candidatus Obscuribacterales bacterium]
MKELNPTTSNPGKSILFIFVVVATLFSSFLYCRVEASQSERAVEAQFYPEKGCPVDLVAVRSVLELDPFGAPVASKIYITYKNNSSKPISAVKFKLRYVDSQGKDKGTFHGPHSAMLSPGQTSSQKWRREVSLSPAITGFKVRILRVKWADGSEWHSAKTKPLVDREGASEPLQDEEPPPRRPPGEQEGSQQGAGGGEDGWLQ